MGISQREFAQGIAAGHKGNVLPCRQGRGAYSYHWFYYWRRGFADLEMSRGRRGDRGLATIPNLSSPKRDHKFALSESPQALQDFPNSSPPQQDPFTLAGPV